MATVAAKARMEQEANQRLDTTLKRIVRRFDLEIHIDPPSNPILRDPDLSRINTTQKIATILEAIEKATLHWRTMTNKSEAVDELTKDRDRLMTQLAKAKAEIKDLGDQITALRRPAQAPPGMMNPLPGPSTPNRPSGAPDARGRTGPR